MIKAKITGGPSMWGVFIDSLTKSESRFRSDLREVEFVLDFEFEHKKIKGAKWKLLITGAERIDSINDLPPYAENWSFRGVVGHLPGDDRHVFGQYNTRTRKGWMESVDLPHPEKLDLVTLIRIARDVECQKSVALTR